MRRLSRAVAADHTVALRRALALLLFAAALALAVAATQAILNVALAA
jgi:hypothetical protein